MWSWWLRQLLGLGMPRHILGFLGEMGAGGLGLWSERGAMRWMS